MKQIPVSFLSVIYRGLGFGWVINVFGMVITIGKWSLRSVLSSWTSHSKTFSGDTEG